MIFFYWQYVEDVFYVQKGFDSDEDIKSMYEEMQRKNQF